MTGFSVQSIAGKSYNWSAADQSLDTIVHTLLGANGIDAPIRAQHSTVVLDISVSHTETKIDQHILAYWVGNDFSQDFPAVQFGVIL